jgi:hypothetical protein
VKRSSESKSPYSIDELVRSFLNPQPSAYMEMSVRLQSCPDGCGIVPPLVLSSN